MNDQKIRKAIVESVELLNDMTLAYITEREKEQLLPLVVTLKLQENFDNMMRSVSKDEKDVSSHDTEEKEDVDGSRDEKDEENDSLDEKLKEKLGGM